MDNQHRQIKGYRELSQAEIDLMNMIKNNGITFEALLTRIADHFTDQRRAVSGSQSAETMDAANAERIRLERAQPERWAAIARTHFQEGLMALTRAVAQPDFF